MGVRFQLLAGLVTLTALSSLCAGAAIAQTASENDLDVDELQTVQEAFEDEYYGASGTFFRNRGLLGTVTWIVGPFPENNIAADGRDIYRLYVDALAQQTTSDPTLRTADLNNPFNTSLLLLPPTPALGPAPVGSFGSFPFVQEAPGVAPAAPAPARPVPGLW